MNKTDKYLFDIQHAISLIENFTKDTSTFADYEKDFKTQSAVERQLAIIGEAIGKLKKESKVFEIENAKQIVDLSNRLIHSYDNIDNAIVWTIIKRHLPELKHEVENI
ncbi:DUF86 domain-containing protein [Bacteroidia bacterium]|nr:DUF86 domain-containing protein [Bacteroidia bacterium]